MSTRSDCSCRAEVRELEPNAPEYVRGGLLVPRESIADPFAASIAFAEVALANGVDLLLGASIVAVENPSATVKTLVTSSEKRVSTRILVNAAGLGSRALADCYAGQPFDINPRRGQFLIFDKFSRLLVRRILLPVPTPQTKGVLVIPTIFGNLIAGPTAEDLPLDSPDATCTTQRRPAGGVRGSGATVPSFERTAGHRHLCGRPLQLRARELFDPMQRSPSGSSYSHWHPFDGIHILTRAR